VPLNKHANGAPELSKAGAATHEVSWLIKHAIDASGSNKAGAIAHEVSWLIKHAIDALEIPMSNGQDRCKCSNGFMANQMCHCCI
jgi:hypothetical protein